MASRAEVLGLMTIGSLALYGCVGEGKRQEPPPPDQPKTLEVDETLTQVFTEAPSPFPTLRPGGPDDETVNGAPLPWPASIEDIPEVRADGGPFTFDVEAENVSAQLQAVRSLIRASGWSLVSTPDQLTGGRTVFVAPFQDKDQWSIQGITLNGVLAPVWVGEAGHVIVMDRPDWATSEVARYVELEQELGAGFSTKWEVVNGRWVPVVRDSQGKRAGFFDIQGPNQEYEYDSRVLAEVKGREFSGVVRVERWQEKWIGFDEDGKPIAQSTDPGGKEWERFERELKIVCGSNTVGVSPCDFLTPDMLEPLDASLVRPIQFVDAEGQIVEVEDGRFPAFDTDRYWEGELRSQKRAVAGVIRGFVPWPYSAGPETIMLYIEVRLNDFESQGLFYTVPDLDEFISYLKVLNPELGPEGVMNYAHVTMQPKELLDVFRNNESALINQQVIFRMQVYLYGVDPQWLRDYALFLEALDRRRGSDVQRHIVLAELFVPRELGLVPEEFIVERCGRSPLLMLPERWCGKSP